MLGWILSAIGILGIGGFIALLIFAPVAAQAVIKIVLEITKIVLSTRIGCAAVAGGACLVIGLLYGDQQGAARVQAKWDAAKIEYAEKMEQLRASVSQQSRQRVEGAESAEETAATAETKRIETYAQTLPKPITDDCRINDADVLDADGVQDRKPVGPAGRVDPG